MKAVDKVKNFFHQETGPLTKSLKKKQGPEGTGLVPFSPDQTVSSVCGFCSTGCNLSVHLKAGEPVNLSPEKSHPVNQGKACPKGWQALAPVLSSDRAQVPWTQTREGKLQEISWDQGIDKFHDQLTQVQTKHGKSAAAFLSTGQITTEEMALLGSLAKFGLGFVEGDGNTRQCMATSAVAYKQSFGFDAPPFSYEDLRESDVLVFIGANPCINHPILWKHVVANRHSPKIIVIDPRYTKTAQAAGQHYPLKPKSDLSLLYGVAKILVDQNWIDLNYIDDHTTGYQSFAAFLEQIDLEQVAQETGLSGESIFELAQSIGQGERVSFWWTMGVNQGHQAVLTAQGIINLSLMTGNIGRPGTGPNSITGQCNAMGSRLFSNTTSLIGGHEFDHPKHRQKICSLLGVEDENIPRRPSIAYDQILDEIEAGNIKFLWVVATNPAHSWIDPERWEALREKLDFLVVQDIYPDTLTAQGADLFLPAGSWGEKEGVLINSERRLSKVNPVAPKPGQAKTDFEIFLGIAQRFGLDWVKQAFGTPAQAFESIKKISAGQPCDVTGVVDYAQIESEGGIQWPRSEEAKSVSRLFEDGQFYHSDKRAKFCFDSVSPPPNLVNAAYPLVLLTGRGSSAQWHTGTRSDRSKILKKMSPQEIYVEINPEQAKAHFIGEGDLVKVSSPRGSLVAKALVTQQVKLLEIFIPMHYPTLNYLLEPVFDPASRQPSYKYTAVNITLHR